MPISRVSPADPDVRELIDTHLRWAHAVSEPQNVFAMPPDAFSGEDVALFGLRRSGRLVAIGALKDLGDRHLELKSMHTAVAARRTGAGQEMVEFLLDEAERRDAARVSLETGSQAPFQPAIRLYESVGFRECGAFGAYEESDVRVLMTMTLPR